MANQIPGAEPKMVEICKFCGCEWYRKFINIYGTILPDEPRPSYVIDAPEFPILPSLKVCHCPCHWSEKVVKVHLEVIREIFPEHL